MSADDAGKRCSWGDMLRGMRDADHALICQKHSSLRTLRLDYLNKVWCDAARCVGVASAVEPKMRELKSQPGVRRHEDAREDAMHCWPGMLVIDVHVVHAQAVMYPQGTLAAGKAAEVDGAAAAMGEHNKEDEIRRDIDGGAYEWEPVVMES